MAYQNSKTLKAKAMNIVFFGSDSFAVKPLGALTKAGYKISCVVTQPDRKKGRGLKLEGTPVKICAKGAGLMIYQPPCVNSTEALDFLKNLNPDLFIVIAYGQLLSQGLLDLPKTFCINAHASILPKYRGAAPINWAIIKGEKSSGVTVIKIISKMDAGPIISQKEAPISDDDTAITLQDKLSALAAQLLLDSLAVIENKSFKLVPQDEFRVSYAPKLKKSDGLIDWSQNAGDIYNLVRGCFDWPGAFTYYRGKILKINKAGVFLAGPNGIKSSAGTITEVSNNGIRVATGKGVLIIEELQLEGKRRLRAEEFIAGQRISVGEVLESKK